MIPCNVTLVVQIGNFLISWWFLERYFFRRYVAEIQKERREAEDLQQVVINKKNELFVLEIAQKDAIALTRKKFVLAIPLLKENSSVKIHSTHPFIVAQECDISMQQEITEDLVVFLVERVKRA